MCVAGTPGVIGAGDALDVRFGELPLCAGDHLTHVAGIDEENFPMAVAVAVTVPVLCEEPQARRDSGVEEELVGQRHDAVHEVCFQESLADGAVRLCFG